MDTYQDYSTKLVEEKELVRITGEQFDQMVAAGIWGDHSPIELWDGFLRLKNCRDWEDESLGHGPRHAAAIRLFQAALARAGVFCVQTQLPIVLNPFSRPEPDLCVLVPPISDYNSRQPEPEDIRLAVECSSSSLRFDQNERARAFAEAGIPSFLIVNLVENVIEVFTTPASDQPQYLNHRVFQQHETLTLDLQEQGMITLAVSDIIP